MQFAALSIALAVTDGGSRRSRPAGAPGQRHPPRVRYVNLTRDVCDGRACFPVIGGALVSKDSTHITSVDGRTLGPCLLRALG